MAKRAIISGFHAMEEALRSGLQRGELIYYKKSPRINDIIKLAEKQGLTVRRVGRDTLEKRAAGQENRGALLLADGLSNGAGKNAVAGQSSAKAEHEPVKKRDFYEYLKEFDQRDNALVLVLDEVTDPQNLGAIMRSCDLFEVDLLVLPQRRSAHENNTVRVTSAGASAYVPVVTVPNLARALADLKEVGFWTYGAQAEGEMAENINFSGKNIIVMGSEGKGLRRLVSEGCDHFVSIPMGGHIDSLNVSVAAGILLYEVRRQDRARSK